MKQQELLSKLNKLHSDTLKLTVGFAAVSRDVSTIINGVSYYNGDDIEAGLDRLGESCNVVSELLTEYAASLRDASDCMIGGEIID